MIQNHTTTVQRTAHYYTFGEISEEVEYFWLATHGYGQVASQIIHKFREFDAKKHFVVAPEALNKFYWKRPTVGASWMTSHVRLDEIADYTAYIRGLYDLYLAQLPSKVKIILFGFSQGCHTQVRWIMNELPAFDHLVLWAGTLPDDLDYKPQQNYFGNKQIHWVYGNEDQFLNDHVINWMDTFSKEQLLDLKVHTFEGTHRIDRAVLMKLWKKELKT